MELKKQAAEKALDYIKDGMVLGLGSGSTTRIFIDLLGKKIQSGKLSNISGVPTSTTTAAQSRAVGIPLTSLKEHPELDIAVDGADEVDPDLNLIKGMGGALLREKIVETSADIFLVIVDESKVVPKLGIKNPVPVEIVQFEADATVKWLNSLGCDAILNHLDSGKPTLTDNNNYIAHCYFPEGINDVYKLARVLSERPGIVEHGLFLNMADVVIVAGIMGISVLERKK